ncbi:hypothetical protein TNCV_3184991 [Trichonephila clavipes]|nr:hypothetical protein TNCV_3184991 [Trichonephila clavipes]
MWEALNTINLSNCRTMYESGTCWGTALAMSSRVANRLPRIGSVILGMRSKSQGEMSGRVRWCSYSSHPQRQSSCRTHSALCGLALPCRNIALSTRSGRLSRTPRRTCRTRVHILLCYFDVSALLNTGLLSSHTTLIN